MTTLVLLGLVSACLGIIVWVSRRQGAQSEIARQAEEARRVEQEMADAQVQPIDIKKRLDNGTF